MEPRGHPASDRPAVHPPSLRPVRRGRPRPADADSTGAMALRIEDYAVIGDTQSAALIGKDGSIDWLCFPRFDSAACFAALLGTPDHGRWLIAPEAPVREVRRRYRGETLVLETEFRTDEGVVRVTDAMPIRTRWLDLVRVVEGPRRWLRQLGDQPGLNR